MPAGTSPGRCPRRRAHCRACVGKPAAPVARAVQPTPAWRIGRRQEPQVPTTGQRHRHRCCLDVSRTKVKPWLLASYEWIPLVFAGGFTVLQNRRPACGKLQWCGARWSGPPPSCLAVRNGWAFFSEDSRLFEATVGAVGGEPARRVPVSFRFSGNWASSIFCHRLPLEPSDCPKARKNLPHKGASHSSPPPPGEG